MRKSNLKITTPRDSRGPSSARRKNARALPAKPDLKATTAGSGAIPTTKKPSKSDIVEKMLSTAKGATREELSKATGWPHVNLKVAAERAGKKLVEDEKTNRFRLIEKKAA